jgi:hypothetical protein
MTQTVADLNSDTTCDEIGYHLSRKRYKTLSIVASRNKSGLFIYLLLPLYIVPSSGCRFYPFYPRAPPNSASFYWIYPFLFIGRSIALLFWLSRPCLCFPVVVHSVRYITMAGSIVFIRLDLSQVSESIALQEIEKTGAGDAPKVIYIDKNKGST